MGNNDILGKHGGGSHMNFETMSPNPLKSGKMKVEFDNEVLISANKQGLISLASHLLSLAQDEIATKIHIHLDKIYFS